MKPLRHSSVCLMALFAFVSALIAERPDSSVLHLKLAGAGVFDRGVDVPVKDAVLFLDSTNFDGKSGFVRLQKGMTVAYLVISSREISGETKGAFEKKPFLQANLTPLPKLPELLALTDFTLVLGIVDIYDPRRQSTSTLQQAMAGKPITKLTSMAPWVSSVEAPATVTDSIHLHAVDLVARTPSQSHKIHHSNFPEFRPDRTVLVFGSGVSELHLQCKQTRLPIDPAPVVLHREGSGWTASINYTIKGIVVRGTFPVRLATPVERTINEYAGKN